MVNIKLQGKWVLVSDTKCWMLEGKNPTRKYFYSTLELALKDYLELRVRDSSADDVEKLLKSLKMAVIGLNRAIRPLQVKVVEVKSDV